MDLGEANGWKQDAMWPVAYAFPFWFNYLVQKGHDIIFVLFKLS